MRHTINQRLEQTPKNEVVERVAQRIRWKDCFKEISLAGESVPIRVPRSACVSSGDTVVLNKSAAFVKCFNGEARIYPIYTGRELLQIGELSLEFLVKEITDGDELAACVALSEYHYRQSTLHGRTARLVVRNFHPNYPKIVGYIELTTPFYMNKARAAILNAPYAVEGIEWDRWDAPTMKRYINLIVRIGRCVIFPEFRGLGLGQMLLKHASAFARDRWQAAGLKPHFLEISADMLKYVPFATKAGMTFVGETEGNLQRVAKDMNYLLKNRARVKSGAIVKEDACGIVDQQVARMERAAALMKRQGWTLEELNAKLKRLSNVSVLRDFDLFHEIVSLPKPTYMQGLSMEKDTYLKKRATLVAPKNGSVSKPISLQAIEGKLEIENLSLSFESKVRRTRQTHAVQQAFGISPNCFRQSVVRGLSVSIEPGNVVLITGSSGAGKTTLLRRLACEKGGPAMEGGLRLPENYLPGMFAPISSTKALVEVLGANDVNSALHLMGVVGLSDAFVYLKRFSELSNGQQYRAMLAQLIASGRNVWLADEFCANLDPLTAIAVADRLQRLARRLGAVLIVASSQPDTTAHALRPDKVIHLTTALDHRISSGDAFLRAIRGVRSRFLPPALSVEGTYLDAIRSGLKCTTIRKGRIAIEKGLLLMTARDDCEAVNVTEVRESRVEVLSEDDALNDGFASVADLRCALIRHYPTLRKTSVVTVVHFELLGSLCPQPRTRKINGLGVD